MKLSTIKIKDMYAIKDITLDNKDVEITGNNATGKTSIIDAIRFALQNKSQKECIVRTGAEEGEILVETDTGISIRRKERIGMASLDTVKDGKTPITKKEAFLRNLFSDLQLNPVEFISMKKEEQNRIILDLIDFKWDKEWIIKEFGELVPEINYSQNILKVLADIQSEDSYYYRTRQEINRESKGKVAVVEDIAKELPDKYNSSDWENKTLGEQYSKIESIKENNRRIEKAQSVMESHEEKVKTFDAEKKSSRDSLDRQLDSVKSQVEKEMIELENKLMKSKEEIKQVEAARTKGKENIDLQYKADVAKLEGIVEENKEIAKGKIVDTSDLLEEVHYTETMKGYIGEYTRMVSYQKDIENLNIQSEGYTTLIEHARELPGVILAQSKLPLEALSIKDGVPLIKDRPISNLSDGEKLDLCVEIANLQKTSLNLVLIDGAEKLSPQNRERLYAKCKAKNVQFIATRTTKEDTMQVVEL